MPEPRVVVIQENADGVYLFRYTATGEFGGDTWHETVEEAQEQAAFEYEQALGPWYQVPPDVTEPLDYAHAVGLISST